MSFPADTVAEESAGALVRSVLTPAAPEQKRGHVRRRVGQRALHLLRHRQRGSPTGTSPSSASPTRSAIYDCGLSYIASGYRRAALPWRPLTTRLTSPSPNSTTGRVAPAVAPSRLTWSAPGTPLWRRQRAVGGRNSNSRRWPGAERLGSRLSRDNTTRSFSPPMAVPAFLSPGLGRAVASGAFLTQIATANTA